MTGSNQNETVELHIFSVASLVQFPGEVSGLLLVLRPFLLSALNVG